MYVLTLLQEEMSNPIVATVWTLLLATGAVGVVTTFALQGIRKASAWLDAAHPVIKQISAVLVAEALSLLGGFFGVTLPETLGGLDTGALQGLLAAGFSMGFYTVLKALGVIGKKETPLA